MFQLVIPFQLELPFATPPHAMPTERRTGADRRANARDGADRRKRHTD